MGVVYEIVPCDKCRELVSYRVGSFATQVRESPEDVWDEERTNPA
jgi:hypothetical protein